MFSITTPTNVYSKRCIISIITSYIWNRYSCINNFTIEYFGVIVVINVTCDVEVEVSPPVASDVIVCTITI